MQSVVSTAPAAAAKRHFSLCGCVHYLILCGQSFNCQYKNKLIHINSNANRGKNQTNVNKIFNFKDFIHVIPKKLLIMWITFLENCGEDVFIQIKNKKSTILWIRLWIFIYIIHIDIYWLSRNRACFIPVFSTRYPQVNHNLWIKLQLCGWNHFYCGNYVHGSFDA